MLHINDLTYRIGERLILDHTTVSVPEGARVGLVGRNGAGKTTLFKLILGELGSESGSTSLPRGLRIGAVAQEAPGGPERLIDVVLAADKERNALINERETATDPTRIAEIEIRLIDIDAHAAPSRAATILHGLGFNAEAQLRPCSEFSGGWRMRVALAAILFSAPDLLLLDEPTNYLDLEGTLWLYDYLGRYPHTALIISHDRELLDTSVNHILHLDRGRLSLYRGTYTSFARQLAEQRAVAGKQKVKQEAERAHLQAFIDRFKATASKASQAQSRMKRLAKLEEIDVRVDEQTLPFYLDSPERPLNPPLIAMDGVSAGYDERVILKRLNLTLGPDDRIALLGPNGNGKSTFCKLLAGRIQPMGGNLVRSSKLDVAFFAQHQLDDLRPEESSIEHIRRRLPDMPEARRRAAAARMGFSGPRADVAVRQLSGGEKARLTLGLIGLGAPHILILDEPTNHLDIDSRAALAEAVNAYQGAVILVSHDRFLIEACANALWLVENNQVLPYEGDLDDYRRKVLSGDSGPAKPTKTATSSKNLPAQASQGTAPKPAPPRDATMIRNDRKLRAAAEERMEKLSALIAKVDAAIGNGQAFARDPKKAALLARQRAELSVALNDAEEKWLELSEG
jgi:ATP-binding cassette, subfamily F, member 3